MLYCKDAPESGNAALLPRRSAGTERLMAKNGEWRMENGEWRVESGEWRMESGEWRVESGEWRMESGEWRMKGEVQPQRCPQNGALPLR